MKENELREFTPKVIGTIFASKYALMLIEVYQCPICTQLMVASPGESGLFPRFEPVRFEAQVKRAGWLLRSTSYDEARDYVCVDCVKDGKLTFTCYLCKVTRDSDHIQESFGDPPERLCKLCYETVPASKWHEAYDYLFDRHKYDHS